MRTIFIFPKQVATIASMLALLSNAWVVKAQDAHFYVQIIEVEGIPEVVNPESQPLELRFTNPSIEDLFNGYTVYYFEKAFPTARTPLLQTLYEVKCDDIELMTELTENFNAIYPEGQEISEPFLLSYTPDDYALATAQTDLDLIRAKEAWGITTGSSDIIIGITDTEFDLDHEDLETQIIQNHGSNGSQVHGTGVAGCAAAATDNNTGISGIGFNCKLNVSTHYGNTNRLLLMSQAGARVLNASWAHPNRFPVSWQQLVYDEIHENGTVIVAGAGNGPCWEYRWAGCPNIIPCNQCESWLITNGSSFACDGGVIGSGECKVYPASYDHVISVSSIGHHYDVGYVHPTYGAINWKDVHEQLIGDAASTHNHNDSIDICAPGYDIKTTWPNDTYGSAWGTSFASPMVAGVCGLVLSVDPCLSPDDVEYIIKSTAAIIDTIAANVPYAGLLGAGRIDAYEAVLAATTYGNVATITSNTTWSGDRYVKGTVTVASGTLTITGTVRMAESAEIVVESGAKLIVNGGTITSSSGCGAMWDGIDVENGGELLITNDALIEDAIMGVYIEYGADYTIENSTFNRNYYQAVIFNNGLYSPTYGPGSITNTAFRCQTTASLGLPAPEYQNLKPPYDTDIPLVGVYAVNAVELTMTGCKVSNVEYGVYAETMDDITISNGTFEDIGEVAIFLTESGSGDIDVIDNAISRTPMGIFCFENPTAETKIEGNTIDFTGMASPAAAMTGIYVAEITPGSPNKVSVVDNDIINAPCGIHAHNLDGDLWSPSTYIGENNISHAKTPNDLQAGILTENCSRVIVSDNDLDHPSSATNWWETGIRISGGNSNWTMCNRITDIGNALFFDNDQEPLTILVRNEMTNNHRGIVLNNAVVGPQGSPTQPLDNEWHGSTWSSTDPHIQSMGTGAIGTDSPFTVRSSGAQYYPTYREARDGGSPVPTPGTTSSTWTLGCFVSPPSYKTEEANPLVENALNMLLKDEDQLLTLRDSSMRWAGHYGLYKQLLADDQLRHADENLSSFFNQKEAEGMGKLHRALTDFNALRNNTNGASDLSANASDHLASVNSLNSEIRVEQRLSEVLNILYSNLTNLKGIKGGQEARLRDIAQLCPIDEGLGVYIARAALLKLDTLPRNYVSECERIPAPADSHWKDESSINNDVKEFAIFPNPTHGTISIRHTLGEDEQGTVSIYNMLGGMVLEVPFLPSGTVSDLELGGIESGIYLLRLNVNSEEKLTERIIIIRE